MEILHWFIVVPYYFFAALAVLPGLLLAARLLRLKLRINTLVSGAIIVSLASIVVPLACDWVDLVTFTGRPLLVLGGLSFVLAGADAALAKLLPLPLDAELEEL